MKNLLYEEKCCHTEIYAPPTPYLIWTLSLITLKMKEKESIFIMSSFNTFSLCGKELQYLYVYNIIIFFYLAFSKCKNQFRISFKTERS